MGKSTKISQRIEDYSKYGIGNSRGNLTDLQIRFHDWWRRAAVIQVGRTEFTAMAFGFKGAKCGPEGRVEPLSMRNPIRPADSLRLLTLVPIAKRLYTPPNQVREGRYRLHYAEHACQVRNGSLVYGGWAGETRVSHAQHYCADAARRPLQDHQIYKQRSFTKDTNSVGGMIAEALSDGSESKQLQYGQAMVLTAPHAGTLAVVRNDLHLRVTLNGLDVYRFRLEDEAAVSFIKTSGFVRPGTELLKLTDSVTYLEGEFAGYGYDIYPKMDRIAGDILSATHREPALAFAVHALEVITDHSIMDPDERPWIQPIVEYFPIGMVQISLESLRLHRLHGWRPQPMFQELMRRAVSPDAIGTDDAFGIEAPGDGLITAIIDEGGFQRVAWLSDGEDEDSCGELEFAIPRCASIYKKYAEGAMFEEGDLIGDYVPREYYQNYEQLTAVADEAITKIEDQFFEERFVVYSGERRWSGDGVLVDGRVAGALNNLATNYFVDITPLEPFIDDEYSIAMCPPAEYDIGQYGFFRQVNGIEYEFTPAGPQFDSLQSGVDQTMANTGRPVLNKKKKKSQRNRFQRKSQS